jgi:hypothetical protein
MSVQTQLCCAAPNTPCGNNCCPRGQKCLTAPNGQQVCCATPLCGDQCCTGGTNCYNGKCGFTAPCGSVCCANGTLCQDPYTGQCVVNQ